MIFNLIDFNCWEQLNFLFPGYLLILISNGITCNVRNYYPPMSWEPENHMLMPHVTDAASFHPCRSELYRVSLSSSLIGWGIVMWSRGHGWELLIQDWTVARRYRMWSWSGALKDDLKSVVSNHLYWRHLSTTKNPYTKNQPTKPYKLQNQSTIPEHQAQNNLQTKQPNRKGYYSTWIHGFTILSLRWWDGDCRFWPWVFSISLQELLLQDISSPMFHFICSNLQGSNHLQVSKHLLSKQLISALNRNLWTQAVSQICPHPLYTDQLSNPDVALFPQDWRAGAVPVLHHPTGHLPPPHLHPPGQEGSRVNHWTYPWPPRWWTCQHRSSRRIGMLSHWWCPLNS